MPRQTHFDLRFEWGLQGLQALQQAPLDAIVVVDVLSFCTCVSMAVARGAQVWPYRWRDERAAVWARQLGAHLAGPRGDAGFSLSPRSMQALRPGEQLVLPSPNGATLCAAAEGAVPLYAGCLRNASAVARAAARHGRRIGVVAAGERWPDDALRPAVEDAWGAGAVLHGLPGSRSPEAAFAEQAFLSARDALHRGLHDVVSGRELIERGHADDVALAAALDADRCAPQLHNGRFVDVSTNKEWPALAAGASPLASLPHIDAARTGVVDADAIPDANAAAERAR